ncbi:MAG: cellulase family glycosylhydrolase [Clostridia bacterium]|nr:cellulase family glycosylhydrolase [Clostridia bacterium]
MKEKWTKEQANAWYQKLGWLRGCNFIGSDCTNRLDMWQKYKAEEKLATAEKELALCEKIGFNTVRLWANFDVYYMEPDSYMEIFDKYIDLCGKYNQKVMVVLAHEEDLPRGEVFEPKPMGEQKYALGVHQGRVPMTKEQLAKAPKHYMEYPELHDKYIEMVKRTVQKYKNDERVFCWNIYNEPGITINSRSIPLLEELFAVVRAEDPIQPLCADIWRGVNENGEFRTEEEKVAFELSDVLSVHSYSAFEWFVRLMKALEKYDRPIFVTEWLQRINHNNVQEIYPFLYYSNIANYCWGFVVGKTQTNEPWDCFWDQWDQGGGRNYDFTKWQHDLFRPNLRPYDPHEIELIERFNNFAKKEGR